MDYVVLEISDESQIPVTTAGFEQIFCFAVSYVSFDINYGLFFVTNRGWFQSINQSFI